MNGLCVSCHKRQVRLLRLYWKTNATFERARGEFAQAVWHERIAG